MFLGDLVWGEEVRGGAPACLRLVPAVDLRRPFVLVCGHSPLKRVGCSKSALMLSKANI